MEILFVLIIYFFLLYAVKKHREVLQYREKAQQHRNIYVPNVAELVTPKIKVNVVLPDGSRISKTFAEAKRLIQNLFIPSSWFNGGIRYGYYAPKDKKELDRKIWDNNY